MRTILFLIRKEFLQIFRNKFISKAIFGVPLVQMLILVPAVTFELKKADIAVIDRDMSPESRGLVSSMVGSGFFGLKRLLSRRRRQTGFFIKANASSCSRYRLTSVRTLAKEYRQRYSHRSMP